ncbi:MAG: twin-arginine translocation pathway signal protein [Burkholderiales bacterium]|jgi:hypothetical protein|nr:twin-arginine translocation pathway signal protein [Burkholderiales bacterium]
MAMKNHAPAPIDAPALAPRRAFIRLVGGGAVLAAGLGMTGCASGMPEVAVQPWRTAAAEPELRRFMLAHALLAPNPHNRQPWIADLREPGRIHLVCDGERLLPETDPFGRQILIGCGAFIELAIIAAAERGHAVTLTPFPQGAPAARTLPAGTVVATLVVGPAGSAPRDPLYPAIARRHTAKTAYAEGRALPAALLSAWEETARRHGLQAGTVTAPEPLAALRRITRVAYEIECTTPATWLESARLFRIGPDAIARHRDGISLSSTRVRLLHATGLFDPMEVPQRGQSSLQRIMDHWAPLETGSGFVWLVSTGNTRVQQVEAGRAYVRQHLLATAAGVDMHPLSQALQEFEAMRGPYVAVHSALGVDPAQGTVQMLARVGYATAPAEPAPRRELAALLRT